MKNAKNRLYYRKSPLNNTGRCAMADKEIKNINNTGRCAMADKEIKNIKEFAVDNNLKKYEIEFQDGKKIVLEGSGQLKTAAKV